MKKLAFVLVAMLALVCTSCKTETSKVTISVKDALGVPVANRYVIYTDEASYIIDAVLPSPEELATDLEECWEIAETNVAGTVTLDITLAVAKLRYYFEVYDLGSNKWIEKDVVLHRGVNETIEFVVNK